MVNYSNGKIYKLVNNVDDKIYIGSTCGSLRLRKNTHKRDAIRTDRSKPYVYTHLNLIGWDTVDIILIETVECKTKDELHRRERHFIDELKPELNTNIPTRSSIEYSRYYREKNLEQVKECTKQWRANNPEHLKAYEKNRYQNNPELFKALNQEYQAKVKNIIACGCGGSYNSGLPAKTTRHMASQKHIAFLATVSE